MYMRKATADDIAQVRLIGSQSGFELGFYSKHMMAESIARSELLVAEEQQYIFGFSDYHHLRKEPVTTLYHICVERSARRRGIGTRLLAATIEEARAHGSSILRLKTIDGIAANTFYAARGLCCVKQVAGKKNKINIWEYCVREREDAATS